MSNQRLECTCCTRKLSLSNFDKGATECKQCAAGDAGRKPHARPFVPDPINHAVRGWRGPVFSIGGARL